jgi:hypothetical protein
MRRDQNVKCVHATAIVVEEYPEAKLSRNLCTWYCQKEYWDYLDGLTTIEISEEQAKLILEVRHGRAEKK